MKRREQLQGFRYEPGPGLRAEVRRSCRNELKIIYEASAFDRGIWEQLATLGRAEVLEASRINPAMRDLFRVYCEGVRCEGAVGAPTLLAFFQGPGRSRARHRLERALNQAFGPRGSERA